MIETETDNKLSNAELLALQECEAEVEAGLIILRGGFRRLGTALRRIQQERLYRARYSNWIDYLKLRWGITREYGYHLIYAAEVLNNLDGKVEPLPGNMHQARELAYLPAEIQAQVWAEALETAPATGITGAHVRAVVTTHGGHTGPKGFTPKERQAAPAAQPDITKPAVIPESADARFRELQEAALGLKAAVSEAKEAGWVPAAQLLRLTTLDTVQEVTRWVRKQGRIARAMRGDTP